MWSQHHFQPGGHPLISSPGLPHPDDPDVRTWRWLRVSCWNLRPPQSSPPLPSALSATGGCSNSLLPLTQIRHGNGTTNSTLLSLPHCNLSLAAKYGPVSAERFNEPIILRPRERRSTTTPSPRRASGTRSHHDEVEVGLHLQGPGSDGVTVV